MRVLLGECVIITVYYLPEKKTRTSIQADSERDKSQCFGGETCACFYQLYQRTWKKVQELGLVPFCDANDQFRIFCGMIGGLIINLSAMRNSSSEANIP